MFDLKFIINTSGRSVGGARYAVRAIDLVNKHGRAVVVISKGDKDRQVLEAIRRDLAILAKQMPYTVSLVELMLERDLEQ